MAYYLKYRPQNIDELDISDVRESLKKMLASESIPHAFLFSGPKGTGKTSAARIVAKVLNCEKRRKGSVKPCNNCEQCKSIAGANNLDVIELDAASHRGIDDVRLLRDAVKLAPAKADNKIYIIDEAHMLTTEASNALLKTLEEPPEHVYFILATTNPEKLIDTIRSRTTQILFRNANDKEIKRALEKVVVGERIKIDNDTMALIADAAKGSLRDSHKLLERIVSEYGKKVSYKETERLLFVNKAPEIEKILGYLMNKDVEGALHEIERAVVSGIAIGFYTEILVKKLRAGLLAKNGLGKDFLSEMTVSELVELITLIQESYYFQKDAIIEQLPLELAIIKWCGESEKKVEIPAQNGNRKSSKGGEKPESNSKSDKKVAIKTRKKALDNNHMTNNAVLDESVWSRILSGLRPANTSIEALLRSAKPIDYDGSTLKLGVYYSFHKERLEEGPHRKILEDVIEKIVGNRIRVICILTKPPERSVEKNIKEEVILTEDEEENIVKVAEEIFGN